MARKATLTITVDPSNRFPFTLARSNKTAVLGVCKPSFINSVRKAALARGVTVIIRPAENVDLEQYRQKVELITAAPWQKLKV